ncbi:MAG TPA: dTMP kinase [Jiangellales bacterium]|nr:dTMP kinase [Jiangellales bacterium]
MVDQGGGAGSGALGAVTPRHDVRGVLAIRPFRRLWLAMAVSSTGDWLGLLALTALASQLASGSYAAQNYAIAGVLLLRLLPAIALAPFAGLVADRLDRRTTMIVGDVLRALIVLSIPVVGTLWWLFVATLLMEAVSLFWLPAKEASIPNMVPRDRLEAANQLSLLASYGSAPVAAAIFTSLAVVSRLLGQVIEYLGTNPVTLALVIDGATFLVSAVIIAGIKDFPRAKIPDGGRGTVLGALVDGWRFVATTPVVRGLVLGIVGAFAAGGTVVGLGRTYAGDLGAGEAGYGLLFGAVFLGLAAGMLLGPRVLRDLSRHRLFGLALTSAGVLLIAVALVQDFVIVISLVVALGMCAGTAWVTALTLLGLEVEDSLRGRTFAFVQAAVRIALAAVLALAPLLAGLIGAHRLSLGTLELDYRGAAIAMLLGGLVATGVGVLSFRQMDDRAGVPVHSDVAGALRARIGHRSSGRSLGGLFVAFEGGDGAGKSTQARLLADWLGGDGHEVVLTHEPGDTRIGPQVRRILLDNSSAGLSARAEALLYAADRAEHVASLIRPALERGAFVVTDRFVDSSIAYQGVGRGLTANDVARVSRFATQGLEPDLTVLLDVPAQVGRTRLTGPADRLESEPDVFHESVRRAFLELAHRSPHRYVVVDATGSPEAVAAAVRDAVRPLMLTPPVEPQRAPVSASPAPSASGAVPEPGAHPGAEFGSGSRPGPASGQDSGRAPGQEPAAEPDRDSGSRPGPASGPLSGRGPGQEPAAEPDRDSAASTGARRSAGDIHPRGSDLRGDPAIHGEPDTTTIHGELDSETDPTRTLPAVER